MTTWINNQRYVDAWDCEVDRKPMARTVCGEPIMPCRRFDRLLVAMRDACLHRMSSQSMGIKEGDNSRRRYHGLVLNSEGKPVNNPEMKLRTCNSDHGGMGAQKIVERLIAANNRQPDIHA